MRFAAVAALLLSSFAAMPARAEDPGESERARLAVVRALESGANPLEQARQLVRIAWPAAPRDEAVSARARLELSSFGNHGMLALREAVNTVELGYTGEVVKTILGAASQTPNASSPDYVPALLDALWTGSREAKSLAMSRLGAGRVALAVQPMIDSALADPEIQPQVVDMLGRMRIASARFYLEAVMIEGPVALRPVAAASLAQIGGSALGPLKNALKSPDRETRTLAVRALIPAMTEFELGAVYEYLEAHGDDDPELRLALEASTRTIEKAIAARDALEAADAPKDF